MEEYNSEDPKKFEKIMEKIRMDRYAGNTIRRLQEMTETQFNQEVDEELTFRRMNLGRMEKFLYNERNMILALSGKFNKEGLKPLSLDRLYNDFEDLVEQSNIVHSVYETYSKITEEPCNFYEQYKRILGDVLECLDLEIKEKEMEGDYR